MSLQKYYSDKAKAHQREATIYLTLGIALSIGLVIYLLLIF